MTIDDKLNKLKYNCDTVSHLNPDCSICIKCKDKICTKICPAQVYEWDEENQKLIVNYENCLGGNMLFVLTANRLPEDAESIEKVLDIASENLDIKNFCYNIYERNQQERFKAYMFITEPYKSTLGDNISN